MPEKAGETTFVPAMEWRDAEARLGLMEEQSRRALAGHWRMTSISVVQDDWVSPLVLPDHQIIETAPTLLLGPDGNPLS